jgi:cytoskeletal protein RodZ
MNDFPPLQSPSTDIKEHLTDNFDQEEKALLKSIKTKQMLIVIVVITSILFMSSLLYANFYFNKLELEQSNINEEIQIVSPIPEASESAESSKSADLEINDITPVKKVDVQPTVIPTPIPTVTPSPTEKPTETPEPTTTGTIEGTVFNSNGQAQAYATLRIWCDCTHLPGGASDTAQADGSGKYSFNSIQAGTYSIQAHYGNYSQVYSITVQSGKTVTKNISLTADPDTVPTTSIVSGPEARNNPGDPANFYCTTISISVNKCCTGLESKMSYDNQNAPFTNLGSCSSPKETYVCSQLAPGSHTFYYAAKNTSCGEETIKSINFTVE